MTQKYFKHYNDFKEIKLSDLITPDITRLILHSMRNIPLGYSELPLEIHLKSKASKKLDYPIPWDGELYGCVRGKEQLFKKIGMSGKVTITLSDWDDKFALIFENENPKDTKAFSISHDEVIFLLGNCRRVPQLCKSNQKG